MTNPFSYVLNYVADAPRSADLYGKMLGIQPVEASPNFVMFVLSNGLKLGLWARGDVEPKATLPGGSELCLTVDGDDAVRVTRDAWAKLGLKILQEPTQMDFGYTFTAADPDGHRLRVFNPFRD